MNYIEENIIFLHLVFEIVFFISEKYIKFKRS